MTPVKQRLALTAIGHFHPQNELDNQFFDQLDIGSSASWIQEVTGIENRRSVLSQAQVKDLRLGKTTSALLRSQKGFASIADMAAEAYPMFLERRGLSGAEKEATAFDLAICGTSVPDFDIPANACSIGARLGLNCPTIDVNSACSSFVANLHTCRGMIMSGLHRRSLVFNVERYTTRVDFSDRSAAVLWGDAATVAAVEVVDDNNARGLEIIDTTLTSDPSGFEQVKIPEGEFFSQNGKAVQKFAITRTVEATRLILERNGLSTADVSYFIGHQANLRMLTSAVKTLKIAPERHLFNVNLFGNQGGAGAPAVLSQNWNRFRPGELIVVTVVGAGLTWGALLLRALAPKP